MTFFTEMVTTYRMKFPNIDDPVVVTYKKNITVLKVAKMLDHCVFLLYDPTVKKIQNSPILVLYKGQWCIWGKETTTKIELPKSPIKFFSLIYEMPYIVNCPLLVQIGNASYQYKIHDINIEEQFITLQGDGNFFFKAYLISGKWKIPMLRNVPVVHNIPELIPCLSDSEINDY